MYFVSIAVASALALINANGLDIVDLELIQRRVGLVTVDLVLMESVKMPGICLIWVIDSVFVLGEFHCFEMFPKACEGSMESVSTKMSVSYSKL